MKNYNMKLIKVMFEAAFIFGLAILCLVNFMQFGILGAILKVSACALFCLYGVGSVQHNSIELSKIRAHLMLNPKKNVSRA